MRYALDTEFIDTPKDSTLLSLALVSETGEHRYFEFEFNWMCLSPWLRQNVFPLLGPKSKWSTKQQARASIRDWLREDPAPEIWAYYGAYDWYWFSRVFGGFMEFPKHFPMRFREFAELQDGVPDIAGAPHHALNDAHSLMAAMKLKIPCGWK